MVSERIAYTQLFNLLRELGFQEIPTKEKWRAFHHRESETLLPFVALDPDSTVRELDVISVRTHLDAQGLLERADFNRFLSTGILPDVIARR
jgi:hypothetical protein